VIPVSGEPKTRAGSGAVAMSAAVAHEVRMVEHVEGFGTEHLGFRRHCSRAKDRSRKGANS